MEIKFPKQLNYIEQLFAVGGAVRDVIMGNEPHDIDFCTPMLPQDIADGAKRNKITVLDTTSGKHGTVDLLIDGIKYEVTTFRVDNNCDGRHAEVEFTDHLELDLSRRDFTINAMAMGRDGSIIDLFDGIGDIRRGLVRGVGNPADRFREDFLRCIRCARFSNILGFEIEDKTYNGLIEVRQDLINSIKTTLSIERVRDEFNTVFERSPNPSSFLVDMVNFGVLHTIISEIKGMELLNQNPRHHAEGDVWTHTLQVVDRAIPHLRWGALLHDIGKNAPGIAEVQGVDPKTNEQYYCFYGHDMVCEKIIPKITQRLKFPNAEADRCLFLGMMHMQPYYLLWDGPTTERAIRRFQSKVRNVDPLIFEQNLFDLRDLCVADCGNRIPEGFFDLFEIKECVKPILMGRHLIEKGYRPGKEFGAMLKRAEEYQIETGCMDVNQLLDIAISINSH